jgi:hypothetical protein
VHYLTQRYSDPDRLNKLPRFEDLPPMPLDYFGSASFFHVFEQNGNIAFDYFGTIRSQGKIQHATLISTTDMLVGYKDCVEHWALHQPIDSFKRITRNDFTLKKKIVHPHFPGLHTVFPLDHERALVSASASDMLMVLNIRTGSTEKTFRMPPDIYGHNYDLTPDMNLFDHYIGNDQQTTHINTAYPFEDGKRVIVSTLIQGAIGVFNLENDQYEELTRGFVGCHGARITEEGDIYFSDSVNGNLVFLNKDVSIIKRFGVNSRWLHDVQQITGDIFAFCLSDHNEIQVFNIQNGEMLYRKKFLQSGLDRLYRYMMKLSGWAGNSTQFLSFQKRF